MAIYLIDYENTKNLSGLAALKEDDTAIIFYSKNANTLTFDMHKEILASRAKIDYKYVEVGGKNALDFQLSTYLGYIISKNANERIVIVSKDAGFSYAIAFWEKEKNVSVELFKDLSGKAEVKDVEENPPKTEVAEKCANGSSIQAALKKSTIALSDEDIKKITSFISQYKTKTGINNALMKYFRDSDKVGAINKIIKPYIKDKK